MESDACRWLVLMDTLVELIKLIGGILGIVTAVFIVWDRVLRGRPIFALQAEPRVPGDNYLFLRIKNVLDEDIVIENWRVTPSELVGLSTDVSVRAIVQARLGPIPLAIVPPLGELRLNLIETGLATAKKEEQITISAAWNTTRHLWPFQRHVKIKTTVARLLDLKGAHL